MMTTAGHARARVGFVRISRWPATGDKGGTRARSARSRGPQVSPQGGREDDEDEDEDDWMTDDGDGG